MRLFLASPSFLPLNLVILLGKMYIFVPSPVSRQTCREERRRYFLFYILEYQKIASVLNPARFVPGSEETDIPRLLLYRNFLYDKGAWMSVVYRNLGRVFCGNLELVAR